MKISNRMRLLLLSLCACIPLMLFQSIGRNESPDERNRYPELPKVKEEKDALAGLDENFHARPDFSTNLPIVTIRLNEALPDYKRFVHIEGAADNESVEEKLSDQEYAGGYMEVFDQGEVKRLQDQPSVSTPIKIKVRGHMTYALAKKQYRIQTLDQSGNQKDVSLAGLGEGHAWILGGSVTDKSLMRNYLAYRVASLTRLDSPNSTFCEVFFQNGDQYEYQGVYLLCETVSRSRDRVNIDNSKNQDTVTSYIVRRDRFTNFDPMLETWARTEGLENEWIGVKYPTEEKITDEQKQYISEDFSRIEQVIYSKDPKFFKTYPRFIDVNSFVDYFLINEFFGNYDAKTHSVYMYKTTGAPLVIGPVWDFDQAMDNYYKENMDIEHLAFWEAPFYRQLIKDQTFVKKLKNRYVELQKSILNDTYLQYLIGQASDYLINARKREWARWEVYYNAEKRDAKGAYELASGQIGEFETNRQTADFEQELYVIRNYLHKHGQVIVRELNALEQDATGKTGWSGNRAVFLFVILILFLMPSVLINRRG